MPKKQNLLGRRFGRLLVVEETRKGRYVAWRCQCDCGNETTVISTYLLSNKIVSCGCYRKDNAKKLFSKDLTGKVFSELTVVGPTEQRKNGAVVWECLCSCGKTTYVQTGNLTSGHTRSCGHLHEELPANRSDLIGKRYGRLKVVEYLCSNDKKQSVWKCKCDCGNYTESTSNQLNAGKKISCGCLKSKGEQKIIELLQSNEIPFVHQKIFDGCVFPESGRPPVFDFFVDNKYLIEYDGEQHFIAYERGWSTAENLIKIQERDAYKNQWCEEHDIPLIRIPYTHFENLTINDLLLEESQWRVEIKQKNT